MQQEPLYKKYEFYNPGVLSGHMPVELYQYVERYLESFDTRRALRYNEQLAGNLEHEYVLPLNEQFEPWLYEMAAAYRTIYQFRCKERFKLDKLWINIQKKHEFNPMHFHYGSLSFVTWIKIPYRLYDELNMPNVKASNLKCASMLHFLYNHHNGRQELINIPVDQHWQGYALMFPADLQHGVYPFYTSDDYRVSISGNLYEVNE